MFKILIVYTDASLNADWASIGWYINDSRSSVKVFERRGGTTYYEMLGVLTALEEIDKIDFIYTDCLNLIENLEGVFKFKYKRIQKLSDKIKTFDVNIKWVKSENNKAHKVACKALPIPKMAKFLQREWNRTSR